MWHSWRKFGSNTPSTMYGMIRVWWYVSLIIWLITVLVPDRVHCGRSRAFTHGQLHSYSQMRQLFPSVSSNESLSWRMSRNEVFRDHPCKRTCIANQPMTCYYYIVVHYDVTMGPSCDSYLERRYQFMSGNDVLIDSAMLRSVLGFNDCKYADGIKTEVMVANGLLPGESIELCIGDTIVADVINGMHETTSIHWHGMHQKKTPHMDGVPMVTQYPIEAGQAFRYFFEVDHVGTHWWHSHTDHQRAFGLAGALIVRQPDGANLHLKLYDFDYSEHVIMLQDWLYDYDETIARNILINGLGQNSYGSAPKNPTLFARFEVVRGGRYRFRVISNGVTNCPLTLSIDDHDLVVIASDGNDIEPVTVQRLTIHGGERFDFVLHTNQWVDNYWMRVKGYMFCEVNKLYQGAIVHYVGANARAKPRGQLSYTYERDGVELNPIELPIAGSPPAADPRLISIGDVNAVQLRPDPPMKPYRTYYTSMSVNTRNAFIFQMDDITFTPPKVSLLQARNLGIGNLFCNKTQQSWLGFNCRQRHCRCTNVIQVPAYKYVEFVLSSITDSGHPMHLHGYTFRVVGMGTLGEDRIKDIEKIDRETPLPRRKRGAPLKDSIQVPGFGYTIIRFYTNNPGYWIFHCHISIHAENGMTAVLRVGEDEQMKMCPVSNCGLCRSVV